MVVPGLLPLIVTAGRLGHIYSMIIIIHPSMDYPHVQQYCHDHDLTMCYGQIGSDIQYYLDVPPSNHVLLLLMLFPHCTVS